MIVVAGACIVPVSVLSHGRVLYQVIVSYQGNVSQQASDVPGQCVAQASAVPGQCVAQASAAPGQCVAQASAVPGQCVATGECVSPCDCFEAGGCFTGPEEPNTSLSHSTYCARQPHSLFHRSSDRPIYLMADIIGRYLRFLRVSVSADFFIYLFIYLCRD